MKRGIKIITVALCVCFAFASFVTAGESSKCPKSGMMGMQGKEDHKMDYEDKFYSKIHLIMSNADELDLSDAQKKQIKDLKYSVKKNIIDIDAEIDRVKLDIKKEQWEDDVNLKNLNRLIDKKYQLKAQKAKDLAGACVSLKGILNKDQQKKLKELKKSKSMMHEKKGKKW